MSGIRFVPQTGTKKNDKDTRKSIRRHVMLGRNQGRVLTPRQPTLPGSAVFRWDDWEKIVQSSTSTIPPRVGSDLSFLEFADTVEQPIMNDTLRFCAATTGILFALEPCIAFNSPDAGSACMQALTLDPLHLNVMVFGAQTYMDQIFWQTTSTQRKSLRPEILRHYGKALSLLRERLADVEKQGSDVSDLTVVSVITLATHALVTETGENARNHAIGLRKLVSMKKNGVYSYTSNMKQMIEILRCDICLSLATGQVPLFFQDLTREPLFSLPELVASDTTPNCYPTVMSSELTKLWDVLRWFCAMINEAVKSQKKVSDQVLLETMASVVYRLLAMSFAADSTDEIIRLSMISFCASALLQWRSLRIPFFWLQSKYRDCIVRLTQSRLTLLDSELVLWCVLIYGVAFRPFDGDEGNKLQQWLMEVLCLCNLTTWDKVKRTVDDFLWIDIIHNRPAQKLVEETSSKICPQDEVTVVLPLSEISSVLENP